MPLLAVSPPPFRCGERRFEVRRRDAGSKADLSLRAMIGKTAGADKGSIACHGSAIMIAALDLVERVASVSMVTIVDRPREDQRLLRHALRHHVRCYLVFEAAHALAEISHLPCLGIAIRVRII